MGRGTEGAERETGWEVTLWVSLSYVVQIDTQAYSQKSNNKGGLEVGSMEVVLVIGYGNNASSCAFHCKVEIMFLSMVDFCTINCSGYTEVT